ncbi:MAG: hypothetical protein AAGU12_14970 [Clostridiales bacterium]
MVGAAAVWPAFGKLFFQAYMEALLDWPYAILVAALLMIHWKIYKEPVQAGLLSFFVLLLSLPAGLLGSLLLVLAGIRAEALPAANMLVLTIVLGLVRPRFICLAYSGSLLCFSSLLFGWPALEVPQVMGLVAILHLVESALVALSGSRGGRPVLTPGAAGAGAWRKHYDLFRLWPLPMVAITAAFIPQGQMPPGLTEMPDWWPLLDSGAKALSLQAQAQGRSLIFALSPFVAMLGYSQRFTSERVYFGKGRRTQDKAKSSDKGACTPAAKGGIQAMARGTGRGTGKGAGKGSGRRAAAQSRAKREAGTEAAVNKGLRHSSFKLLAYSLILFSFSWLAARQPAAAPGQSLRYWLQYLPPLWGLLGHEWIAGSFGSKQ